MTRCNECERKRPKTHRVSRYGGGNFRRGGRWYRSSICEECAERLFSGATDGHDTTSGWSVQGLRDVVRAAGKAPQCRSCPWKTSCDPTRDIPNGYSVELHQGLAGTCVSGMDSLKSGRAMACHYSKEGKEFPCAGWLHNQLGPGNNIAVRLKVMNGTFPPPVVQGEQHKTFEDTLP